jgi:hypothetical protein
MTADTLTSIRELDCRVTDGIRVRLLWSQHDDRLWVSVMDTRRSTAFRLEVAPGERPLDVFHHPFAYAGIAGRRVTSHLATRRQLFPALSS